MIKPITTTACQHIMKLCLCLTLSENQLVNIVAMAAQTYIGIVKRFVAAANLISVRYMHMFLAISLQVKPRRLTILGRNKEIP
jgi:hypothetical protein